MRILWWSNAPWTVTAYGQQTALFAPRIQEQLGHAVSVFAFYGLRGARVQWGGLQVYPQANERHGNDAVSAHAKYDKSDLIISLMDLSMVDPRAIADVPWCPWFPVDCEPMRPAEVPRLRKALQPLVFSRFAEAQAKAAGVETRYIPHGVDRQVYRPLDKQQCREAVGLPTDKFIIGMVAMNKGRPSRKAFPEVLQAYARLHEKHPDTLLYLHAHRTPELDGLDLVALCRACGLEPARDVAFVSHYANAAGLISNQEMARVYNSLDLLASPSYGEGFGVPILEAQACGVPVVVGDWSAMPEICFSGWRIPKTEAERFFNAHFNTWQYVPHIGAIADCFEQAYLRGGLTEEEQASTQAWADQYDADLITRQYWGPALAEIEQWVCQDAGKLEMVRF